MTPGIAIQWILVSGFAGGALLLFVYFLAELVIYIRREWRLR